ncbi:MAG: hypothetical protein J0I20_21160 [Chloroflexi bacterium]|nr:hypothetical protein [Chloroflexota bacterium]OJV96537.1 MAG: hypothetical protein BGO39_09760 [Chloroflexi bacterium 54-19]
MEPITSAKGTRRRLRWGSWLAVAVLMLGLSLTTLPALPALAAANIALSNTSLQPGEVPVVSGIGFNQTEKISLWLTAPDRTVQAYGATYSDANGNFNNYSFPDASNFTQQPGFWYITAQGLVSNNQAIASFTVGQVATPPANPNPPVATPAPVVTPPPPVEVAPGAPTLNMANNIIRLDQLPVVSASGYNGGERVDFWLTGPDGSVKTYGFAYAQPDGTITSYSNPMVALNQETQAQANARATGQLGLWYITGHGTASDKTGVTNFVIAGPTLTASISSISGNVVTFTYSASNFYALESVSMWLTDAYGHVTSLGSTYARLDGGLPSLEDSVGNIISTLNFLNNGLTGPYTMTAQGQSSHFIVQTVLANPLAS